MGADFRMTPGHSMATDYRVLDARQLHAILHHVSHPVVLACLAFYYESNLSLEECVALRWSDVNPEEAAVMLTAGTPYPLTEREYQILTRWGRLLGLGRRMANGTPNASLLIFPIGNSQAEAITIVESSFVQAVKDLGWDFTFRDLTLAALRRNISTIDTLRTRFQASDVHK